MEEVSKEFYVYGCYVDGVLKYIGKGKGNRYTHCTSGASTCTHLNRDFFSGRDMQVKKLKEGMADDDAKELEKLLISIAGEGLYNVYGNSANVGKYSSYTVPRNLLRATGIISKEGVFLSLTLAEKLLYVYFLDKLVYNRKMTALSRNMDDISEELGIEKKTVWRSVKKFTVNGLLRGYKDHSSGAGAWVYESIETEPELYKGDSSNYMLLAGSLGA